ncbi:MAG: type II toxin-antitoxin system RelE/ParE family toxin [Acidobacteria bacterium]|nr:type II toxin-antitoxin system RelE/ParE family toxin [Acidobacteriota bacterium]
MIRSFRSQGSEDVFNGENTRNARKTCPRPLWELAAQRLDQLDSAEQIEDLRVPPGNRLEALGGDRRGQYSIRINRRYRICFEWSATGPENVEIVDYH